MNGLLVQFLDLFGLLYHTAGDRKDNLADTVLSTAHTLDVTILDL